MGGRYVAVSKRSSLTIDHSRDRAISFRVIPRLRCCRGGGGTPKSILRKEANCQSHRSCAAPPLVVNLTILLQRSKPALFRLN